MRTHLTAGIAAASLLLAGCGTSQKTPAASTVTRTATQTVTATQSAPAADTPSAAAPQSWVMPNLIGRTLQAAQDAVQAVSGNPAFFSSSTDLTGKGRMQINDRNWQVCTSTPAPGELFSAGTAVDFGVVKLDIETCP